MTINTKPTFGETIRAARKERQKSDSSYSMYQVANRIDIQPDYLSKIERGVFAPPSEEVIVKLAQELDINPDYLLGLARKIRSDVAQIILERPQLIAQLIRKAKNLPDSEIKKFIEDQNKGDPP